MNQKSRNGFKWSVNEVLALQREFELLGWTVGQIAEKHRRTPNAIMYKLEQEGLADYNVLYSNYYDLNAPMPVNKAPELSLQHNDEHDDDDEESNVDNDEDYVDNGEDDEDDDDEDDDDVANLSERVYGLEESVTEIKDMIKQMMSTFSKQSAYKTWF